MSLPRALAKPVQSQFEILLLKSTIVALALNYLPRLPSYLTSKHVATALPTVRWIFGGLWGLSILKHIGAILNHTAQNGWSRGRQWKGSEEIIIVTGGASGIGALVVDGFVKRGAKVVIFDVNEPKETFGPNVSFHLVDVTSSSSISKAARQIRDTHGAPTALINNAGIGFGETILEASEAHIRSVLNVNLLAHFLTVKEFLPSMIERNHGHVVTVASMASMVTIAQNVDYSCTKVGVLAFHEGLRQELNYRYDAPMVRTSIIHPSWVRTPLTQNLLDGSPTFPKNILEPGTVATAIVNQVVAGHSGQRILPEGMKGARLVRAFPHWLQERIRGGQKSIMSVNLSKR